MVRIARQIVELLYQRNTFASSAPRWLADETLVREMSHMLLQVFDFIWQKEGVGHEAIIDREETLQSTYDHTEDILLGEMVHQGVAIDQGSFHLD